MLDPDYNAMTPEEEAALVPSQYVKSANGTAIKGYTEILCRVTTNQRSYGRSVEFPSGIPTVPSYLSLAAGWLDFFAATGRLPRRVDK